MHAKSDKCTPRDIRQLDYIAQFMSDTRYIKGADNIVADTLSQSTIQSINAQSLNFDCLAEEQRNDTTLDAVKSNTSLQMKQHPMPLCTTTI